MLVFLISIFFMISLNTRVFAEYEEVSFDKETKYNIFFQVSEYGVYKMEDVYIFGVKGLGEIKFLVVNKEGSFLSKKKDMYILLSSIKSIVPSYYAVIEMDNQHVLKE